MPNPLFNNTQNANNPLKNLVEEAKAFKQPFRGNPREEVQKLLNSGRMTQQQFNYFAQIVQNISSMF